MNIITEPGWYGHFTREQADGAITNGSKIMKANSEVGDATPDGTTGTVLGSMSAPDDSMLLYFIEWSNRPRFAVACMATKVAMLQ